MHEEGGKAQFGALELAEGPLATGAVYLCTVPSPANNAVLLLTISHKPDHTQLLVQTPQAAFFDAVNRRDHLALHEFSQHCEAAYFGERSASEKSNDLTVLLDDAQRLHPAPGAHVLICASSQASQRFFHLSLKQQRALLQGFCRWAQRKSLRVVLSLTGKAVSLETLAPACVDLAGLASLEDDMGSGFLFRREFWIGESSSCFRREASFIGGGDRGWQLERRRESGRARPESLTSSAFFAEERALYDASSPRDRRRFQQVAATANELLDSLTHVERGLVVLGYESAKDIPELAKHIQMLRLSGKDMRIVVREIRPSLRYADEQCLLRLGVDLVVPVQLSFSRFVSQLDGLCLRSGQLNTVDVSAVLAAWYVGDDGGYLSPSAFEVLVREELLVSGSTEHALVALRLAPGIHIEDCLNLCERRRGGDVLSGLKNELFFFFYACRPADVKSALQNTFRLPPEELFENITVYSDLEQAEPLLAMLRHSDSVLSEDEANALLRNYALDSPSTAVNDAGVSSLAGDKRFTLAVPAKLELGK